MYRCFQQIFTNTKEYALYLATHLVCLKQTTWDLKKKTSQIQKTGIMLCILLDLSEMKPTIGRKQISTKYTNAWRLNNS